ncbi:MAG: cytochrome c-type biogenesis protein CcmH [Myxococcaceae bacterium]
MNAFALSLAVTLLAGQYAPQQAGSEPLAPEQEARVQKLGKELRCAVCQGLAITDSPASMARAQLDKVRELITEGKSDDEVKAYFVARYGEWVLLRPPTTGAGAVVWIAPVLVMLIGAIGVTMYVRGNRRREPVKPATAPATAPATDDDYLRAVRSEADR